MRILFDDEAMTSRSHVRIELNRAKTEVLIGTVQRNSRQFDMAKEVYSVPRHRIVTAQDLATAVDYYAKVNRVSNAVTANVVLIRAYELRHGTTIDGNI